MATYTLVPNATATPDAGDWSTTGGAGTIHGNLAVTAGTISTAAPSKDFRVDFTTQALGAGETIDSIQACITAHTGNTRSETAALRMAVEDGGNSNANYFFDDHTVTENGGSPATYCSAVETTSDGSTAWTQGDIDTIRMMGEVNSFSGGSPTCVIYEAYITVETTIPAGPTTYPSEDQVSVTSGILTLSSGTMTIK